MQDKRAEMAFSDFELLHGVWEESKEQTEHRRQQLALLNFTLLPGKMVLDAGCGPGTYGLLIAAEKGCDVIGVDISFKNAKVAKARAKKIGCSFFPITADLENLPFRDNSFDLCLCAYILHHFPNASGPLADLSRVVRQDGSIALFEPNGSNPLMLLSGKLEDTLRGLLCKLGLDSPNEKNFRLNDYNFELAKQGFTHITVVSHYFGGLPPLPNQSGRQGLSSYYSLSLILFFVQIRRLLFIIGNELLPSPANGVDLLILGSKNRSSLLSSMAGSQLTRTVLFKKLTCGRPALEKRIF